MKKKSFFFVIILMWMISSCVVADKSSVININDMESQLIGDGNVKWVLDKERTSGSLGNDPDSDCVQVYHFDKGGSGKNQCIGNAPDTQESFQGNQMSWKRSGNAITINGEQYDFVTRPDHCFISLVALKSANAGRNLVFRREPQPATGCKE